MNGSAGPHASHRNNGSNLLFEISKFAIVRGNNPPLVLWRPRQAPSESFPEIVDGYSITRRGPNATRWHFHLGGQAHFGILKARWVAPWSFGRPGGPLHCNPCNPYLGDRQ
ncbi:hypothetical protein ACJJTC_014084 [Scirpophaga incertulas]